jgi:hypothetical protein
VINPGLMAELEAPLRTFRGKWDIPG